MNRSLIALACALAGSGAFLVGATRADGGCGFLGMSACPAVPDPGGDADRDVPIPPPDGKRFGFNTQLYLFSGGVPAALEAQSGANVKAAVQRYTVMWKFLQPRPGDAPLPDGGLAIGELPESNPLHDHDAMYQELVQRGMTPVLTLLGAPPWATDHGSCAAVDRRCQAVAQSNFLFPNRAHLPQWQAFVAALAKRYPKAVIEPWNEPNVRFFWQPTPPDAEHMARLQCAAYRAVKALPSPNKVIAPGFAGITRADASNGNVAYDRYAGTMYRHGLKGCMDNLSVHIYADNKRHIGQGSGFAYRFKVVRDVRRQYGDSSPIWITETGSSSYQGGDGRGISEAEQAEVNKRIYNKLMTMSDVEVAIFHSLRNRPTPNMPTGPEAGGSNPQYNFGFLREDMTPKPVYCAFALKAEEGAAGCAAAKRRAASHQREMRHKQVRVCREARRKAKRRATRGRAQPRARARLVRVCRTVLQQAAP